MSGIEDAMKILRKSFNKYAKKDGDKSSLSKREVSSLLKAEFLRMVEDKKDLKDFFEELDLDGDGTISFPKTG